MYRKQALFDVVLCPCLLKHDYITGNYQSVHVHVFGEVLISLEDIELLKNREYLRSYQ